MFVNSYLFVHSHIRTYMKVILLQNIDGLGKVDEVKEVKDGYALNFLFPRHLAVTASAASLRALDEQKQKRSKEEERDLKNQQRLASKLDGFEVKFLEKGNEKGALYSAVGPQKIAKKLAAAGYGIDKNQIEISPIKEAGEFKGRIKFRHGLDAGITAVVEIVK